MKMDELYDMIGWLVVWGCIIIVGALVVRSLLYILFGRPDKERPKYIIKKFKRTGEYFGMVRVGGQYKYMKYEYGNIVVGTDMKSVAKYAKHKQPIIEMIERHKEQESGGELVEEIKL